MDKQNQAISVKINGKERKVVEFKPRARADENASENSISDEVAAAQEEEEDFSWVLPDESIQQRAKDDLGIPVVQIEDLRKTLGSKKKVFRPGNLKKNHFFPLKTILFSTVLAIIVGTSFGFIILQVTKGEQPTEEVTTNPPPINQETNTPPVGEDKETQPDGETTSLQLNAISPGIIQGGKFTTVDSANLIVTDIKSKGYAATIVEQEGSYYVYIGIGPDKNSMSGLLSNYESSGLEYFFKTIEIKGGTLDSVTKVDSTIISNGIPLFNELMLISPLAFQTNTITDEQWTKLTSLYEKLNNENKDGANDDLKSFAAHLSNSYESLKTFKSNQDKKSLWTSQQSLLEAFKTYVNLTGKLS